MNGWMSMRVGSNPATHHGATTRFDRLAMPRSSASIPTSSGAGLPFGRPVAAERDQAGGELDPGLGGPVWPAARLEPIDGVLEQLPGQSRVVRVEPVELLVVGGRVGGEELATRLAVAVGESLDHGVAVDGVGDGLADAYVVEGFHRGVHREAPPDRGRPDRQCDVGVALQGGHVGATDRGDVHRA